MVIHGIAIYCNTIYNSPWFHGGAPGPSLQSRAPSQLWPSGWPLPATAWLCVALCT